MRTKSGLWLVLLTLLSFFVLMTPQTAHAQTAPASTTLCPSGNALDKAYNNNVSAFQQSLFKLAHNINTLFPIAPAFNQCVQNIQKLLGMLPGLGNPVAFVVSVVTNLLVGIIDQVCSAILGTITAVQTALTELVKICIPLPQFNLNLDIPSFGSSCSGGTSFSPITGWSSSTSAPLYNYRQYFKGGQ